jgi:hypothetical protein
MLMRTDAIELQWKLVQSSTSADPRDQWWEASHNGMSAQICKRAKFYGWAINTNGKYRRWENLALRRGNSKSLEEAQQKVATNLPLL